MSDSGGPPPDRAGRRQRWLLAALRYGLPAAIALAGVIVMWRGGESGLEGGAGIVGAALAVYALNWFFRYGVSGEQEREAEQRAREYFASHGHWPGERPREPQAADQQRDSSRPSRRRSRQPARLRDRHGRRGT